MNRAFACLAAFLLLLAPSGLAETATPATKPVAPPPRSRAEVMAVLGGAPSPEGELRPLHILLVAGPKDHGPGEHDYPGWQRAWEALLAKASKVKVSTAWQWPTPGQLKSADIVVCYFKSSWTSDQINDVKSLHARGGGLVLLHWAIAPDKEFEKHQEITGLTYKSAQFRHGELELKLAGDHPILRGLPRTVHFLDESYWPILGDPGKVTMLATSDEMMKKSDLAPSAVPVLWTYEPPTGKGRSFVSILGHYAWTFEDPYFRLLVLRGMAWSAGESTYRFDALSIDGVRFAPEVKAEPK